MGNSLRCCLACVIPCGALDLIRIVHLNGQVEEIAHPITAGEVLNNNPNHVLSKPSSSQGMVRRIMILSPESELKRGSIYFLIPATSVPDKKKKNKKIIHPATKNPSKKMMGKRVYHVNAAASVGEEVSRDVVPPSEKKSPCRRHRRRSGKVGIWRPHLESISED
ncbi:PREDICTED: uncharacterized protein LOC109156357 [Ipomoea nil]|uniref:uncharacterized protein LOC109156357 n=1 Tax=Ipomoea nil TaxID=35883 RepID=UPI0009009C84|nr:PREDICTED: uncharacterized protein LOC109156357 [Ipomoea nil]